MIAIQNRLMRKLARKSLKGTQPINLLERLLIKNWREWTQRWNKSSASCARDPNALLSGRLRMGRLLSVGLKRLSSIKTLRKNIRSITEMMMKTMTMRISQTLKRNLPLKRKAKKLNLTKRNKKSSLRNQPRSLMMSGKMTLTRKLREP